MSARLPPVVLGFMTPTFIYHYGMCFADDALSGIIHTRCLKRHLFICFFGGDDNRTKMFVGRVLFWLWMNLCGDDANKSCLYANKSFTLCSDDVN